MKTLAISFHGTVRVKVKDLQKYLNDDGECLRELGACLNNIYGSVNIDIDDKWHESTWDRPSIKCEKCGTIFESADDMPMEWLGEDYTYVCPNCHTDEYLQEVE